AIPGRRFLEAIADAAQRLDVLARPTELLPQPLDVCIDRARGHVSLDAPHILQQTLARLHAASPREQCREESKLERREHRLLIVDPGAVATAVEPQAAERHLAALRLVPLLT